MIIKAKNKRALFLLTITITFILCTNCASTNIQRGQNQIRQDLSSNDTQKAAQNIELSRDKGWYLQKDFVLYNLELGTTCFFADMHIKSMASFELAKKGMEDLITKSASRAVASIIGNDNQLDYDGSDIESLYANTINALNYLSTNNLDGALVEAKQISFKLEQLTNKFGESIDQDWLKQQNERIDWDSPTVRKRMGSTKARIRNSAWSRYLSTIIYAKSGYPDDARIESELLTGAIGIQQELAWGDLAYNQELDELTNIHSYNVLLVAFTGASPVKSEVSYRDLIPIERDGKIENIYVKYAMPVYNFVPTTAAYVDVVTTIENSEKRYRLPLIEHLDEMQLAYFDEKKSIIYARAIARATAKIIGTEVLKTAVKENAKDKDKKDEAEQLAAEAIAGIFSFFVKEATENADLRSWQSLPAKVHASTLLLPPGTHDLYFEFFDVNERLIYTDRKTIEISEGNTASQLFYEDAMFWN